MQVNRDSVLFMFGIIADISSNVRGRCCDGAQCVSNYIASQTLNDQLITSIDFRFGGRAVRSYLLEEDTRGKMP